MRALALLLALAAAAPAGAQQAVPECERGARDSPQGAHAGGAPVYNLPEVHELPGQVGWREFQAALERRYPPDLRKAGVSGMVRVCLIVEADGRPSNAWITHSTDARFDQPTLDAIHLRRFRPARVYGRPVRVWMEVPIQWLAPADARGTRSAARPRSG